MTRRTISHYEIRSKLGSGGMGEVFRAYDSKLQRDVAIKVLPASLAEDVEYVSRLRREAVMLASVNHPNIAAIYGLEDHAIVMELIEGETVAARLQKGPLPFDLIVCYGMEIASALAAAHGKGMIHRDLKPGNVMLTKAGVKVLDFGLAKRTDSDETITAGHVVMGTPAYMAPEQSEGRPTDARTDIFGLGMILYEMATGKRARPDVTPSTNSLPPSLAKVIENCLRTDPEKRWQSATDVGIALSAVPGEESSIAPARQSSKWARGIASAAILLIAAVLFAVWQYRPRAVQRHATELYLNPPLGKAFNSADSALSADGRMLAFVTQGQARKLWVRALNSPTARELSGTDGASLPFWAPDNRSIGFFAEGKLKRIDLSADRITTLADAPAGRGGTWNSDDIILFSRATNGPIWRVPAAGGEAAPATKLDPSHEASHRFPFFLPDGRRFIFFVRSGERDVIGTYVASLDDSDFKKRVAESRFSAVYSLPTPGEAGTLLWMNDDGSIVSQPFDPRGATTSGTSRLVPGIQLTRGGYDSHTPLSASHDGTLVYGRTDVRSQLTWYSRTGEITGVVGEPDAYERIMRISPDGLSVAVPRSGGMQQVAHDVWALDLRDGAPTRITVGGGGGALAWSPDGRQIAYLTGGPYTGSRAVLHTVVASGGGTPKRLTNVPHSQLTCDWSPNGNYIVYTQTSAEADFDLWAVPFTGNRTPFPYLQTRFQESGPRFSPDGKWIAYTANESGRQEVYVSSFPERTAKLQVSTTGGSTAAWSRDGHEIYYRSADGNLMTVAVEHGKGTLRFGAPRVLFPLPAGSYDVTPDGRRFLVFVPRPSSEVLPLTIILNWQEKLQGR